MENKATISDQWEAKLRQYQDASPNDENFRIPPMLFSKIQKIVQDPKIRRYTTVDEFLIDSLDLFTTWWTRPEQTPEMMAAMWKDMTLEMKAEIKKTSPEFYQQMEMQTNPDMQGDKSTVKYSIQHIKGDSEDERFRDMNKISKVSEIQRVMRDVISGYGGVDIIRQSQILYDIRQTKNDLISYEKKSRKFSDEMKFLKNLKKRKDSLEYDGYPLIWSFYTRLFPVRIALIVLGHIINEQIQNAEKSNHDNNILSVDFEHFAQQAYEFALFISNYLRQKESVFRVLRNYRISTGLPVPMPEYISPGSPESYDYRKKVESSKLRFIRQFLGKSHFSEFVERDLSKPPFFDKLSKPWEDMTSLEKMEHIKKHSKIDSRKEFFGGLLNATGLAQFFRDDKGVLRIGFTQEGFDFYMLRNEIIQEIDVEEELDITKIIKFDSNTDPIPLSKEECSFLIDNIIPKFPLELEIIRKVLLRLDDTGKLGTGNIDSEIEIAVKNWEKKAKSDPKMTTVQSGLRSDITRLILTTRIATMGRLTELDVVEWEMERGRSSYTKGKNFDMCMKSIKKK